MPVMPATLEAYARRLQVLGQPGKLRETLFKVILRRLGM